MLINGCLPLILHGQTGRFTVWANGNNSKNFRIGKFRSGPALTICRNPYQLQKLGQRQRPTRTSQNKGYVYTGPVRNRSEPNRTGSASVYMELFGTGPGARFLKVPVTFRARKAILCARCLH